MAEVDLPVVELTPDLARRREAVADLGDALRALVAAAVACELPVAGLREVTAQVSRLAGELGAAQRAEGAPASVDDLRRGQRLYNPVVGLGNPLAPPLRVVIADGVAIGTCTLGLAYEGPLGLAHGGVSALLLDQIMGYATAVAGYPAVTGRLEVRYLGAVPLGLPLVVRGEVVDALGVRVAVRATISRADDPGSPLVVGDGRFLMLRPAQSQRLFGPGT